jgi:pimeloyl-ACP methyl ester carboxylesterase
MDNLNLNSCYVEVPRRDPSVTLWLNEELGIRADAEFAPYTESRSAPTQAYHWGQAVINGLKYQTNAAYMRAVDRAYETKYPQYDDADPIGRTNSAGLVVLLHGLNGQCSVFNPHVALLREKYPEFDVIAPQLPEAGVCSREEPRCQAFWHRLGDWAADHPGKSISLIAQSNGSCQALNIDVIMRDLAPSTPIILCLTGPVLGGSEMVKLTHFDAFTEVASKATGAYNAYEDLKAGSAAAVELLKRARAPLGSHVAERCYVKIAPYHDHLVYNLGGALAVLNPHNEPNKVEIDKIVFDLGHNAAVTAGFEHIPMVMDWMKNHSSKPN